MPTRTRIAYVSLALSCCLVIFGGVLAIAGHLWSMPMLYRWMPDTSVGMALSTACLFVLLGTICLNLVMLLLEKRD